MSAIFRTKSTITSVCEVHFQSSIDIANLYFVSVNNKLCNTEYQSSSHYAVCATSGTLIKLIIWLVEFQHLMVLQIGTGLTLHTSSPCVSFDLVLYVLLLCFLRNGWQKNQTLLDTKFGCGQCSRTWLGRGLLLGALADSNNLFPSTSTTCCFYRYNNFFTNFQQIFSHLLKISGIEMMCF